MGGPSVPVTERPAAKSRERGVSQTDSSPEILPPIPTGERVALATSDSRQHNPTLALPRMNVSGNELPSEAITSKTFTEQAVLRYRLLDGASPVRNLDVTAYWEQGYGQINLSRLAGDELLMQSAIEPRSDKERDRIDKALGYRVVAQGKGMELRIGVPNGDLFGITDDQGQLNRLSLGTQKVGAIKAKDVIVEGVSANFLLPIDLRLAKGLTLLHERHGGNTKTLEISGEFGLRGYLADGLKADVQTSQVSIFGVPIGSADTTVSSPSNVGLFGGLYAKWTQVSEVTGSRLSIAAGVNGSGPDDLALALVVHATIP